ncbi:MAG TPA: fibronectin type III domain-containing protein [Candidatus Nitrosotenuis sp.]|nr:fibronectin type III domain-containing protein [Candidatus Nitrosotenuis sp.]
MGKYGIVVGILFVILLSVSIQNQAYGGMTEWKSEYIVGILENEPYDVINHKVSTYDKNSLKIEWEKSPYLTKVIGYKVMRKTLDTDYKLIVEQNNKQTSFLDKNLPPGYYGYKVIPIIDKKIDQTTKHGITRTNNMFKVYLKGQELLAKEQLRLMCSDCFSIPFEEINRMFSKMTA